MTIIGIVSGKGGVGKTTVAVNLSTLLKNKFKRSVVVIDGNVTTPNLSLHLGMYDSFPITLKDVLKKRISINKCVYVHPLTGLPFVPCSLSPTKHSEIKKLRKKVGSLNYEFVIIDAAPGLGREAASVLRCADEILVISTPQLPPITEATKTMDLTKKFKKQLLGLVLNRVQNRGYELTRAEIKDICDCDILATIPEDENVHKSVAQGIPVTIAYPHTKASLEFKRLAATIAGVEYNVKPSIFSKLFGWIR